MYVLSRLFFLRCSSMQAAQQLFQLLDPLGERQFKLCIAQDSDV
jgi:hypothetical protein